MKLRKIYPLASFKALENEGPGRFEAVVSVFGSVDLQGDRTMEGSFKNTLTHWRKMNARDGSVIPIIWSHDWLNPDAYIGEADPNDVMEIVTPIGKDGTGGLYVKGTIDVHKPFAAQVFDLLKSRRVKEWSWAYDTVREQINTKDGANELLEVELIEAGPCLKGAHPDTYTMSAKSIMEKELEETYEAEKAWKHNIELLANWDAYDIDVARVLTRTYTEGPTDAKLSETPEFYRNDGTIELPINKEEDEAEGEKIATKPWHVEKRGDQWCVIKDSDGTSVSCHDTEDEANAQVRALYANEGEKTLETEEVDAKLEDPDGVKWDGDAAMRKCHTAGDFRSIAFEKSNDSDPDTAAHWALPHHASPHGPADDGGVSAALGRLNQTGETVMSKDAIENHLRRHQGGKTHDVEGNWLDDEVEEKSVVIIPTDDGNYTVSNSTTPTFEIQIDGSKIGRAIGQRTLDELKADIVESITGALDRFATKVNGVEPDEEKSDEPEESKDDPDADIKARLNALLEGE